LHPAPRVAGEQADQEPNDEGERHAAPADHEGHAAPVEDAAQHVPSEMVRAERILPASTREPGWRLLAPRQVLQGWRVRGQDRRQHGCEEHEQDKRRARRGPRPAAPAHRSRTWGFTRPYTRSVARLTTMTTRDAKKATACTSGKSRWKIAWAARRPMPGYENTLSIRTAPPSMYPKLTPISVISGMAAFLRACRYRTVRGARPFAHAVRM